ncbi:MAG: histidine--tRNA ligase [Pseudomonadota bacterium]
MGQKIQAIRGMNDILPQDIAQWQYLERVCAEVANSYAYQEIRTPILEMTELFARSIGEVTDIVAKEMYTFTDRDKRSITLRPEGTASIVRAGIEHSLFYNQVQRLWYCGPIFRHERPQRGRYRQFYQFGVEAFGMASPEIDAEIIAMSANLWDKLGIADQVSLEINNLGTAASRKRYREVLVEYLNDHYTELDEDSQKRLQTNPLRILDSKNPALKTIIANAPSLADYLETNSSEHFASLCELLENTNIKYQINTKLVRGLDYYTDTVFEWITAALGSQGTVLAGGRYDTLVQQLGGQATPAIGFAMGCERVLELLQLKQQIKTQASDIYLVLLDAKSQKQGFILAEKIRKHFPTRVTRCDWQLGSAKSQFKRADKSGAALAIVIGENELAQGKVIIKYLRQEQPQALVGENECLNVISDYFKGTA